MVVKCFSLLRKCGTFVVIALVILNSGCRGKEDTSAKYKARGRKVEIVERNNKFVLLRNGQPYYIKGAAGYKHYDRLKAYGGNSVRVWHTDNAQQVLDEAQRLGLTVTLGIWLGREYEGFDYYDKKAVADQLQRVRQIVIEYKDHPALLMWGVGNELYAEGTSAKVWDAVNEIAGMIHEIDPDHPTTTTVMNVPQKEINLIARRCPAIDLLSINSFGAMQNYQEELSQSDWEGPYLFSEFGARGYWETHSTEWFAPIEQTSSGKADFTRQRYKQAVETDPDKCLGTYVFMWGDKYEKTPTWFTLITENGQETETVQVMQELWSGKKKNKAPYIAYLTLNNKYCIDNVYLRPGQTCTATVYTFDPEGDSLQLYWEVLPETFVADGNSVKEVKPEAIRNVIQQTEANKVSLLAPAAEGAYRLYVYVYDGQNNVGTANFPFYVSQDSNALSFTTFRND